MIRILAAGALAACLAMPLQAQDRGAIEDTIRAQMTAFLERDVAGAFTYASPMIRQLFQTPENFGMMVQQGYPMVWDNRDLRFLGIRPERGGYVQSIMVRGPRGDIHVLDYLMIETETGWQINGVSIVPAPDVGV